MENQMDKKSCKSQKGMVLCYCNEAVFARLGKQ